MADLVIDPVTRISGNASIRLVRDEGGSPGEARLQAFGYRGFDLFARGSHVDNLVTLVSRICGGDSVFHQVAAARAVEAALGIEVPAAAGLLRELCMWGQLLERHAVSLTVHSLPDLLLPSSDPGLRNIISIHRVDEEVVRRFMALKSLGTLVLREAGGRAVHAVNVLPGGVVRPMGEERRSRLAEKLGEARSLLVETARLIKLLLRRNEEVVESLGEETSPCLALRSEGEMGLLGGRAVLFEEGAGERANLSLEELQASIEERNSPHSHIRVAEIREVGSVRVGPLARVNVYGGYGSELADAELEELKTQWGFPFRRSMLAHAARILEMIHAWEMITRLLRASPGEGSRATASPGGGAGTGAVEAPEGMLVYGLELDAEGTVKTLSITAPLQFNVGALERCLLAGARSAGEGPEGDRRAAVLLETAARSFAPCIPCALH
ncbi:MAG: nickel-dependent hydrogenase large subunit [Actinobacteria bacterium]|nr:nickel-dependent hydrogenase large subunit [Actinomycetota bacterium]